MAVIYLKEDPSTKALREAIVSVGDTIAGQIVRTRKYEYDVAKETSRLAHQKWTEQLGNKRLALSERNIKLAEDRARADEERLERKTEATEGFEFWTGSLLDLKVNPDGTVSANATKEEIKLWVTMMSKDPEIRAKYQESLLAHTKLKRKVENRVNHLKALTEVNTAQAANVKAFLQNPENKPAGLQQVSLNASGNFTLETLAGIAQDEFLYQKLVTETFVRDVKNKPTAAASKAERYFMKVQTDFADGSVRPEVIKTYTASPGQKRVGFAYDDMLKVGDDDKVRRAADILDEITAMERGFDPADKNFVTALQNLTLSQLKTVSNETGFIYTNIGSVRNYLYTTILSLMGSFEAQIKDIEIDGSRAPERKGNTKKAHQEAMGNYLTDPAVKEKLKEFGIQAAKDWEQEKTIDNFNKLNVDLIRRIILDSDPFDPNTNLRASQVLARNLLNNYGTFKGRTVEEIIYPHREETAIGKAMRGGGFNLIAADTSVNHPELRHVRRIRTEPEKENPDEYIEPSPEAKRLKNHFDSQEGSQQQGTDFHTSINNLAKSVDKRLDVSIQTVEDLNKWIEHMHSEGYLDTDITSATDLASFITTTSEGRKMFNSIRDEGSEKPFKDALRNLRTIGLASYMREEFRKSGNDTAIVFDKTDSSGNKVFQDVWTGAQLKASILENPEFTSTESGKNLIDTLKRVNYAIVGSNEKEDWDEVAQILFYYVNAGAIPYVMKNEERHGEGRTTQIKTNLKPLGDWTGN